MRTPVLVHGTRPLLRTVMEVGRGWALMSDGDSMLVWWMDDTSALAVGARVADLGAGRFTVAGIAGAYREADEEGDMRREDWSLAA